MDQGPIFIGGLAHSGKTPLRLMLSAHPHIAMTRRLHMWDYLYNRFGDLSQPHNFERCLAAMMEHKPVRDLVPDPDCIRRAFWQGAPTYARLFALVHEQHAERSGKPRWGEQLGFVERLADPIFAAFPTAKMIHLIRDPRERYRDVMAVTRHRRGKVGWATARWIYSSSLTQRNERRYPGGYKVVRYETLVSQPERTLRDICAFLNEAFVPDMLAIEATTRAGEDSWVLPKSSSQSMSRREIAFTQKYARQHMLAFDYSLASTSFSLRDRLTFYLLDWPANRTSMAVWNIFRGMSFTKYLEI